MSERCCSTSAGIRVFTINTQLRLTVGFATLFFAIFAVAPLLARQGESKSSLSESVPLILALVNAAGYFLQIYVMYEAIDTKVTAWFALALAAVYIFLSRRTRARATSAEAARTVDLLHLGLAIGFITVAIPIRLDAHWITMGWFVEAAVLLWVADRVHSELLNVFAARSAGAGRGAASVNRQFLCHRSDFQHADGDLCGCDCSAGGGRLVRQPAKR